tara:strand:+ start:175 stop:654 length:480 start_codon:yes stop_codon:yes gene_type:complete
MKIGGLLKSVVGAVAPTLGTALGGPMGGMAAKMISEVLGVPNTPKAIDKAIQEATPEQMLELKKAEQQFELQMKELSVDVFKLETADIQDARGKFSGDWTARIMGILVVGGFMGYIFLVTLPTSRTELRSINKFSPRLFRWVSKRYYKFLFWSISFKRK